MLYDVVHAPGVAIDLDHIDSAAKVAGFLPDNDGLKSALTGADIVVIPAGNYLYNFAARLVLKNTRHCPKTRNDTRS